MKTLTLHNRKSKKQTNFIVNGEVRRQQFEYKLFKKCAIECGPCLDELILPAPSLYFF